MACPVALPVSPPAAPVRCPSGERGIALLIVFLLVLILVPFAGEFAVQVTLESRTARNVTDQLMIENAIDGQFEIVLSRLRYDYALDSKLDAWDDEWNASEIRERREEDLGVAITTRVFDEQGKFDLRLLAAGSDEEKKANRERLKRILLEFREDTPYEMSSNEAESWAERISDYVTGKRGANLPSPKMSQESPIQHLMELLFLEPLGEHRADFLLFDQRKEDEVSPGLHRYVTVYGTKKLNLNTADLVVLRAYFPKDPEIGNRIVERRDGAQEDDEGGSSGSPSSGSSRDEDEDDEPSGNPYTKVEDIKEVEGVTDELLLANGVRPDRDFTVSSQFFSCRIVAVTEMTRRDELFVVERVKGKQPEDPLDGFRFHLHEERTDALEEVEQNRNL